MKVRCVCCQKEDSFENVSISYVHIHSGECSRWLRDREDFGPSLLWKLGNSNLTSLVCFVVGIAIMLVLVQ